MLTVPSEILDVNMLILFICKEVLRPNLEHQRFCYRCFCTLTYVEELPLCVAHRSRRGEFAW